MSKKKPTKTKSVVHTKATASLEEEVKKDLDARDRALAELFNEKEDNENQDS